MFINGNFDKIINISCIIIKAFPFLPLSISHSRSYLSLLKLLSCSAVATPIIATSLLSTARRQRLSYFHLGLNRLRYLLHKQLDLLLSSPWLPSSPSLVPEFMPLAINMLFQFKALAAPAAANLTCYRLIFHGGKI
ncbi:uncharacterized protein LOC130710685 isoform X2 [Lotus japonicus]|uniref:uncharacterized protein LOC130710685 isoform X2 n=1 Tax=Lotus japonicus TaxID=34305 RepID=UPI002585B701|nr:uncharacterized protein LOC130710685 isoform X2 [Lotus japonicus]